LNFLLYPRIQYNTSILSDQNVHCSVVLENQRRIVTSDGEMPELIMLYTLPS
jgi:hypothetical protein